MSSSWHAAILEHVLQPCGSSAPAPAPRLEVWGRLFLASATVRVHLAHADAKLGVRSRAQLTAEVARRAGPIRGRPANMYWEHLDQVSDHSATGVDGQSP